MLLTSLTAITVTGAAEDGSPLAGRWTVTKLGEVRPATPVGDITFDASDKTISGATACNFFQGGYGTSGSSDLKIDVGRMTRRGCPGPAAAHERGLLEAMAATRSFRRDGDVLHIVSGDGRDLAELIRTPDATLEGRSHKIVSYFWNGGLYSAKGESVPAIAFKDGVISGNTGCRPFVARYRRDGDRLSITELVPAQTLAPCAENVSEQDAAILAAVPRITAFDTSRNLIRLLETSDGAAMLWVTPAAE